ncbi:DUF4248 domain-containing protein [Bacteroides sp. 51]|uniref:DUF4248 domain-containing protein n=1 Tax=Bacteroides sp. 51 TaxID=2302938 RepID=UPI0013D5479F|nr:DUF4248 domain-containing protein [Bacteroides sp. 51]NDV83255.1 DUF4248 domain-containing protein [Bacteroides sp. 51]
MNEESFKIRAYSKAELAALYNPQECLTVALQTLSRWIRTNPALMEELNNANYNKYRRGFTPREVAMIVRHLGEP